MGEQSKCLALEASTVLVELCTLGNVAYFLSFVDFFFSRLRVSEYSLCQAV